MELSEFKNLVLQYKIIFFDAYGVIRNYQGPIDGIKNTFQFLHENNIDFYVLTNDASRSPRELADVYKAMDLAEITEHKMISSGMLAREYLRYKVKQGIVAYLGTNDSAHYIETLGLTTVSIDKLELDQVDNISAVVLLDDEGYDWNHDINKAINLLRKTNIPVIVANTDKVFPVSDEHVAVAVGGIADMMEQVVGKVFIRFGKPDAQMFNFAYEHAVQDKSISKNDIIMVGDTLGTDIIGGNKFGIDTALVLTGNTLPEKAALLIETTGIIPNYICKSAVV